MARTRRFLAPQARAGNGHGYLSQPQRQYPPVADEPDIVARIAECRAMCDEPEAPSQAWVNAEAELAAERNRLRLLRQAEERQQARRHITIENRMKAAQNRAKLKRLDLTREFFVMRKMLERGKNQDATQRLETLEARLDGVHDLKDAA
jgi:hypothetical protein